MRFTHLALPAALLVGAASADTANCWGKALHPTTESLKYAIKKMDEIASAPSTFYPGGAREDPKWLWLPVNHCEEVACYKGAQVRWCNDDTEKFRWMPIQYVVDGVRVLLRECRAVHDGEIVAGGMLTHPDKWSITVQAEDACKGKK
ncbi:hypothetical protein ASPSYDRAFT_90479 [Aspergillus sydowii CBS 593.65]|uniref:Ricin B lectin domain-containing protein n=1 Tax=Aspergillus sydowii CBS 593.65 TaxID=1036612 RepID=A0A1L9TFU1_9EURO|nr:uncharacterized protein ASPSYDRAFT_90479 [Aspergillus sydowii CBS 593.65]OJJ58304.1 hypothetical protein ASPSYDRAFT_90479 [Aspergillus sydowii CBS 593.65]